MAENSTQELVSPVCEVTRIIDGALVRLMGRELLSSGEFTDLLLDIRNILADEVSAHDLEPAS